jgi:hypothetical protein
MNEGNSKTGIIQQETLLGMLGEHIMHLILVSGSYEDYNRPQCTQVMIGYSRALYVLFLNDKPKRM